MTEPLPLYAGLFFIFAVCLGAAGQPAVFPTAQSAQESDPIHAIDALRSAMVDSFNRGNINRLLSHLDQEVVVTWQNGEVCRGPGELRAYYEKMMTAPDHAVSKLTVDPKVVGRNIHGDTAVSWGLMNDDYILNDGTHLNLNSHFTATIARRDDEWKVTSFHASVNAFDNPVLSLVEKKTGSGAVIGGGLVGLLVGAVLGVIAGRRKKNPNQV